jgi:PAS domain S-box-containing protein
LLIGRLLMVRTPPEKREEAVFEIVNQFNRGAALIARQEERDELAELNLLAGQRAKVATAYASALTYLTAGEALLPENSRERRHGLRFALALNRAECEFLTGALTQAEQRLAALSKRAANTVERATVAGLRVELYTTLDQSSRAIAVGLDYLRHLGIDWSPHPTEGEARREYERIWSQIGSRTIESLIELPLMSDPASLATLDVLTKIGPSAFYTDANLLAVVTCRAVNLSLERGNGDASCSAYVLLSMIAGPRFGDYRPAAYRFGQLGYNLVERRGRTGFQARTYMDFGNNVLPWTKHVRVGRDLVRRAFEAANKMGDLNCAASCCNQLNTNLLAAGDPLAEAEREAEHGLAFAQKARYGIVIDAIATQLGLIRTLRGLTTKFGSFDDERFNERLIERRFSENRDLAFVECWYWVRMLQARFFAGDYTSAIQAAARARRLLWTSAAQFETAEYHFYSALAQAACCDPMTTGDRQQRLDAVVAHQKQLQLWAANCPDNFENRAALVGAEIARLEGRELDAMRLYEEAIRAARENGFIHNEALANELAARFYAARGFETISDAYLGNARYGYLRWGADGKVRQLEEMCPRLRTEKPSAGPTSTIGTPVEHLDLATVIKVSQAVASEMVLEKLIDTLMRTAIEQAGAERGLLILSRGAEPRIEAEATTDGDAIVVRLHDESVTVGVLPEQILYYVLRARESVVLDDAAAQSLFSDDPYVRQREARSILCLPLINQAKLTGVLYLENNLTPRAFVPARIAVLKLLASQAAITLENARLYRDLERREAKIRRLVDANIIGIFIFELEGRILEANDAFFRMVGYDREDLVANRLRWTELTPPEWLERDLRQLMPEQKMTGRLQPFEKEYFRKDGSRVPVLIGTAIFEEGGSEGVAFVVDLTERKLAEAEARESEQRYREMQTALAHANRVVTMGQLTASIAHEVSQPIAAAAINAEAASLWLAARPPDLEEVRQTLARIVESSNRAGEVIGRIRALIKKAPLRKDRLEINAAIREVMELTTGEAEKNGVSVHTQFADGLALICGDRVQLQQVILNLIINAVQAMAGVSDGPRELLVTTTPAEPDGVMVAVRDTGPGLPPLGTERLFDAFYTTKADGMWMGLSICRSIIEAHGGRLWAGANLPRGAVFQFTAPPDPDV